MKLTLLEIVQKILVEIDGDEVNSISDTTEAESVAGHVSTTYLALISSNTWAHTRRAVAVTPRSDSNFPTHMKINENVKELIFINYNVAKIGDNRLLYKPMKYLDADQFLMYLNKRDNTKSNVDVIVDDSGIQLLIQNDKAPTYYTSFNDVDIVFDSYDKAVDSTLQESKVQAQAYVIPEFRVEDDFVPDFPADAFSKLIEESTSRVQFKMRQFQDIKSEAESQRQSRNLSQKSWTINPGSRYPNYGRNQRGNIQRIQPWPDS